MLLRNSFTWVGRQKGVVAIFEKILRPPASIFLFLMLYLMLLILFRKGNFCHLRCTGYVG